MAAILRAIWPLLPMPLTMTLPLADRSRSTARLNSPSRLWPSAVIASPAKSKTRLAAAASPKARERSLRTALIVAGRINTPCRTACAPRRGPGNPGGPRPLAKFMPNVAHGAGRFKRGWGKPVNKGFRCVVRCSDAQGIACVIQPPLLTSPLWGGRKIRRIFRVGSGASEAPHPKSLRCATRFRPPHKGEVCPSPQCAKISVSAQPARSSSTRVGRKSKQALASPVRPSRASIASSASFSRCR